MNHLGLAKRMKFPKITNNDSTNSLQRLEGVEEVRTRQSGRIRFSVVVTMMTVSDYNLWVCVVERYARG